MFPEAPVCDMTVVTVTQKTENDMTAWSAAVEQERDQMLASVSFLQSPREHVTF